MPNFANQLKDEINRLAKKAIRSETLSLKKTVSQNRSEIIALKRKIAELEGQIKKLTKAAGQRKARTEVGRTEEPAQGLRFRVAGFASLRQKLGLSAADMGRLIGVSGQTIYHWEGGKARPQPGQLAVIAAVRKMGKRAVAQALQQS